MDRRKLIYLVILVMMSGSLACSLTGIRQQAQSVEQTAQSIRTEVGGIVTEGKSVLGTAEAIATQNPGVLETVKAVGTVAAPVLGTIEAVATNNPGLVQTAQSVIQDEIPTGEAPGDIPTVDQSTVQNYFGASNYILYTSTLPYSQVHDFYKTEMPNHGWQYLESDSHEFANAAQLSYDKDNRTATVNLSLNPLNNTTVVVINIVSH
jgi:hypothetical protein